MIFKYIKRTLAAASAFCIFAGCIGCSGEKHLISYETDGSLNNSDNTKIYADVHPVLLLPSDPDNGAVVSAAHANAYLSAANELGISDAATAISVDSSVPESAAGANPVFGAGYDFMNPLDDAAKANPGVMYACFGGYKYNSTNYSNYCAALFKAQYLAGIAAAYNSTEGIIGIISEYATEYPDSAAGINGFALGAMAVNPNIQIILRSLSSRTDMTFAAPVTRALIYEHCDVISVQCDSDIPANEAIKSDVSFIGFGTDMSSYDSDLCLTSVILDLKGYYKSALSAASAGEWSELGNFYGDLSDGSVYLSALSSTAAAGTDERINSARELLNNGLLEIFSNRRLSFSADGSVSVKNAALVDVRDNIMISENGEEYNIYNGDTLTPIDPATATSDRLASANMNYLVKGILYREQS